MRILFLIATPILFSAALICQFLFVASGIASILWNLCFFFPLLYMYSVGTFRHTALGRLSYIVFPVFIIGLLFKLMHWPYASILILTGLSAIVVIYCIHFIMKRKKKLLDWMKFFAITIKAIASMFWISHWNYREELAMASMISLIVLVAVFYIHVMRNDLDKEEPEHAIANAGNDIFNYKNR